MMDPEGQAESLYDFLQRVVPLSWLSMLLTLVIVIVVTAIISRLATKLLRRWLSRDNSPLPSSSIFINITRVVIWAIGISVVLSTCFDVDVSAAVTALGIGGIAVSLGFQDTLSNLISGVQVSITGIVEPGDNISVGGQSGIVRDVTWRHTAIENAVGERIIIPNSVINSTALVKLRPLTTIVVPVVVTTAGARLAEIADKMETAATAAVSAVDEVVQPARTLFTEVTDYGYRGTLTIVISDDSKVAPAKNAILRAIAPFMHLEG